MDIIEIPFGAKDSELHGWEYKIPDGYVAEIKDGKVIVREKESEDDRIKKSLINELKINASLRYEIDRCGWNPDKLVAWLEKQKDASKAIEAVERIDKYIKYIRAHTANTHDMDDSHPDKKYYSGVDDTLCGIAGILEDVYSEEKPKEQKPIEPSDKELEQHQKELFDFKVFIYDQAKEHHISFVRNYEENYEGCFLDEWNNFCTELLSYFNKQKEQKPEEPIKFSNEFENQVSHLLTSVLNGEYEYNEGFVKYAAQSLLGYAKKEQKINEYPLCETIKDKIKCYIANHFIADKVVTTDIPSIVHAMEEGVRLGKEEQNANHLIQIADNNKAIVEDIRNGVPTKTIEETRGVKFAIPIGKEEKPNNQWSEEDEDNLKRAINICINDFGEKSRIAKFLKSLPERFDLQPKQAWSEEDKEIYNSFKVFCQRLIENKKETFEADPCYAQKMLAWLKSLRPQQKQEWSKEDEEKLNWCINLVISQDSLSSEWKKEVLDWLKSIRSSWKPSKEQLDTLKFVIGNHIFGHQEHQGILESLYNDLKKL